MAGKGRKVHQQVVEEEQTEKGEPGAIPTVAEVLMHSQRSMEEARREAEQLAAQQRREDKIAEEAREEARQIAAEKRADDRRRADRIADEERAEARAEAKAMRKLEEAKRAVELEGIRVEAAKLAEKRAYDQQVALIKMQADIGEKAAEAHRLEGMIARKKDRAVAGIPNYREPEDVEDFLVTSERKLKAGEVPEREWLAIVAAKLSGKVGAAWQDLCGTTDEYQVVKCGVLRVCGYTPKLAGEAFYGFKAESLKGMSADQVYHRGAQLLKRMVAPKKLEADVEFALLKPWVWSIVGRKARQMLDARVVGTSGDLVGALQDYLVTEGERTEGLAAVFKGEGQTVFRKHAQGSDPGADRKKSSAGGSSIICFKCGKTGHKAADCWQGGGVAPTAGSKPVESGSKIVCYICGVEGHKSNVCPGKKEKEGVSKSVKQLWLRDARDTVVVGEVNRKGASLLLDSGAHITIVPEGMVGEELRTGNSVMVRAFQSKSPIKLPTANVRFSVKGLGEWEELVALAPSEIGKESEVLYGLDLQSARGLDLVILVNRLGQSGVNRVTTRSEGRQETSEREENAKIVAKEKPRVKAVVVEAVGQAVEATVPVGKKGDREGGPVADRPAGTPRAISNELELKGSEGSTGKGEPVADRPAGNPEPVARDEAIGSELPELVVAEEEADLLSEKEFCLRESREGLEDLGFPPVKEGSGSRAELVSELRKDPTLESWRELADKGEQGFSWDRDLLYQARTTHTFDVIHLMVLPQKFRGKVMRMAHEGSGHLGARKVKGLLKQRFIWPGMGLEVVAHCRSCEVCQKCAKPRARSVPLMEREVLSEPFEVMAFDLVGPFPKSKGGYRFVLTAICMSSKWPEAIPLKFQTARAVATGMVEIFSRTGIPLQLLTDQGSQFLGSLVTHLCRDLRIDRVRTAPYHPECNGVVERMHGTLNPMLTKASRLGLDWVEQLPFAMFALRSAPSRDSSFSPYQLVYGHRVRTPLDILHQGWAELSFKELETGEWADWLVDRLEIWHDLQRERGKEASKKRKCQYDKGTVDRKLEVGDLVLCRVPGMVGKLEESWHGPYPVKARKSRVDYEVQLGKRRSKVLHLNNMKKFYPREEEVLRLALVAEDWAEDEVVGTRMFGTCEGFEEGRVVEMLKGEFPEVFSNFPGKTSACSLVIDTGTAAPKGSHPYRIPNRLKEGVREEIEKLVELGIVVPSTSPWASPVVPVPKADGSVRVCVDYRKLNEVTTADPYYMATMEEILERVGESKVMSKLDLAKGFYQVVVEPQSREKTAFISPFGKFEFTRMPFGLKNAPAIFQRLMEVVLRDCYHCSAPYIDDIVVFSNSGAEHIEHLRLVLDALRKFGMTVKEDKCQFGKEKVEYLGHVIGGGVLAVPAHRAAAMADYIQPKTKRQLRSFLGAAGYYRQFIKGYANMSAVLSPWTSKSAPSVVNWTPEGLGAFDRMKVSLVDVCCLTIPTQEDTFTLHCDASGAGIGATLNVWRDGKERPVAFYSKQLQGAQHHYSATELEGLAVFKSVHYFSHYLYGCRFTVVTDHKALVRFLHSRVLNRRLHGWLLQLLQFDFIITYRPGVENSDADALSRQAWDSREGVPSELESVEEARTMLRTAKASVVGGDVGTTHTRSRAHTRGGAQEAEGAQTGSEQGVRPAREGAGAHTEPCDGDGECEGTEPLSNSHICD